MDIPGRKIESGESVCTEAFPRGGDGVFIRAQVIDAGTASGDLTLYLYTKNPEDNIWDDASPIGSKTLTLTNGTVSELHVKGTLKKQLRLKVTGPATSGWALIRIFPPLFYDSAIGTVTS
jgi:hypothetical protein